MNVWNMTPALRFQEVKRFFEDLLRFTGSQFAKILIVSRDIAEIRSGLLGSDEDYSQPPLRGRVIEYAIKMEDTAQDIRCIASHHVQLMNMTNPEERDETERKLSTRCEGMFLWLRLAAKNLKPGMSNSQLTRALESMPTGLNQAYRRDLAKLSRLDKVDRVVVKSILRWLLFATRPLTVMELLHALAINADSGTVNYGDIPDLIQPYHIQARILDICGSLVVIREGVQSGQKFRRDNYTVHFVHFSAKQFLLNGTHELDSSARERFFFFPTPVNSHGILTNSSLIYLLSEREKTAPPVKTGLLVQREGKEADKKEFSVYASLAWPEHLQLSSPEACIDLQTRLFKPGPVFERWRQVAVPDQHINPLETACWLNLVGMTSIILQNPMIYQKRPSLAFGRALHLASLRGNSEVLQLLLAHPGADVNALLEGRDSHADSSRRDVHAFHYVGKRPLHVACQQGHIQIIELLLARKDVDINLTDEGGWTPLHCSCMSRKPGVVELLLGCPNVAVNTINKGDTPLFAAIERKEANLVELLIKKDALLGAVNPGGRTSLHAAVGTGDKTVIEALIRNGADVNADNCGMTPLHDVISTSGGKLGWRSDKPFLNELAGLLIKHGANVNTVGPNGAPPLHTAIKANNPELVKLLINNGADVNTVDLHHTPPLHTAIESASEEIVKLLIAKGADVNAVDMKRNTPLHKVIGRKAKGERSRTSSLDLKPWSPVRQSKDKFVNNRDGWASSARHIRTQGRYLEVVKQLLETGTNVNAKNVNGSTPLDVANAATMTDVIELIERYQDFAAINRHGQIPPSMPFSSGLEDCNKLLQHTDASKVILATVVAITDHPKIDEGTKIVILQA